MTLEELRKEVPELENYLKYMPKEILGWPISIADMH